MCNSNIDSVNCHFTARVPLATLGIRLRQMKIMETIGEYVTIAQKTVKDTPLDKLTDSLINILAGGQGQVESNKRVRPDVGLQRAFGRERCAEQSVISDTYNACTTENVEQMAEAVQTIYRRHSEGYRPDYQQEWQLLDIDLTGQPCGPKAAFATAGYFAHQRNRRGRKLGRVWASWYQEIVVDQLYAGNVTLHPVLPELVEQAATVLELDAWRRERTILRLDAHGGHISQVNALLSQGYQVHTKEGHGGRARQLADTVTTWVDDPQVPGRQVGWVEQEPTEYNRPVTRIAVRARKKNKQWGIGVLISSLAPTTVAYLTGLTAEQMANPQALMFAYVYFYDLRSGGVETSFKEDKQALGINKRNKKRFEAQQMMMLINLVAHNFLIWTRRWLAQRWPAVLQFGLLRFIRNILHLYGSVYVDSSQQVIALVFNRLDPVAQPLALALKSLLSSEDVVISLGKT